MGLFRADRTRDQLSFESSVGRIGRLSRAERHLIGDAFGRGERWAVQIVESLHFHDTWASNLFLKAVADDLRAQGIDPNRPRGLCDPAQRVSSDESADEGAMTVT